MKSETGLHGETGDVGIRERMLANDGAIEN